MDYVIFSESPLAALLIELQNITRDPNVYRLRFAIDEGGLKIKVNEYAWSPAYGTEVKMDTTLSTQHIENCSNPSHSLALPCTTEWEMPLIPEVTEVQLPEDDEPDDRNTWFTPNN